MKKMLLKTGALALLIACLSILSACSAKPNLDLETVAKKLDEAHYEVYYNAEAATVDQPDILKRLTAAKGDESLNIVECDSPASAKLYYEGVKMEREQQKAMLELQIKIAKHTLRVYDDDLRSTQIHRMQDQIKDYKAELEEIERTSLGRSGNFVWVGTKAAIEKSK